MMDGSTEPGSCTEIRALPLLAQPRPYLIAADFSQGKKLEDCWRKPSGCQQLHLEIGSGSGEFAIGLSQLIPHQAVVAIERKLIYLLRGIRKLRGDCPSNLCFIAGNAHDLVERIIAPQTVDAVHIYFPDPWPKARHAKRRIFRPDSLLRILHKLKPNGVLHIRTDVRPYFELAHDILMAFDALQVIETPSNIREIKTNFEGKFQLKGLPTYHRSYQLTAKPQPLNSIRLKELQPRLDQSYGQRPATRGLQGIHPKS